MIRIVGDKFPSTVKKAIVDTLKSLLIRGVATLKPFLPQLQTTYVKCLSDPAEAVRSTSAESLGILVRLAPRTEPLINELTTGAAKNDDSGVRLSMCQALAQVLLNVPQSPGEATQDKLVDALLPRALGEEGTDADRDAASWALALVVRRHLPEERADSILNDSVAPLLKASGDAERRHGAVRTLAGLCWSQAPQLAMPNPALQKRLLALVQESLPKLLGDTDASVLSASAVLLASAARLQAEAGSWDPSAAPWSGWAEKLAAILAAEPKAGRLSPEGLATALNGVRHYGAAAASTSTKSAVVAQLAAAAAARGLDSTEAVAEAGERAVAALLSNAEGSTREADIKNASEACAGALKDAAAAKVLRDYAAKRLKSLSQLALEPKSGGFAWDL